MRIATARASLLGALLLALAGAAAAQTPTPQSLPFTQDLSDTTLVRRNNDFSTLPGILSYCGADLVTATGVDPQTVLAPSTDAAPAILANQRTTTFTNGGVAEVEIANPTLAFQGSGSCDAPNIVVSINTTDRENITVSYTLRDLDASADNAISPVALQYRIGNTGDFINVPGCFVADASTANTATQETQVSCTLPAEANNQPEVQIRIITTNAAGNDELIGVDNISVTGQFTTAGGGTASANALRIRAANPARGDVRVVYSLPEAAQARLAVYDVMGRQVATLVNEARQAGSGEATLQAGRLAPGVYLLRLEAGAQVLTQRLTVVR